jgi:hypothetical protein
MNAAYSNRRAYDSPATYQIVIQGVLAPSWSERLEGMAITPISTGDSVVLTSLVGELADQNALAGVLNTLVDSHLTLVSLNRLSDDA